MGCNLKPTEPDGYHRLESSKPAVPRPFPLASPCIDRNALIPGVDILGAAYGALDKTAPCPVDPAKPFGMPVHPCYAVPVVVNKGATWGHRETLNFREGLFLGSFQNFAVILYEPEGPFCVPVNRLVWTRALCSPINLVDFWDGYGEGAEKGFERDIVSRKSLNRIPNDYGRGFMQGYQDGFARADRTRLCTFEPYNECVRSLQIKRPSEWGLPPEAIIIPFEIVGYGHPDAVRRPMDIRPGEIPKVQLGKGILSLPAPPELAEPQKWSKLFDRCENPRCSSPNAPHKGSGYCRTCYPKMRKFNEPEFRERLNANNRAFRARKKS